MRPRSETIGPLGRAPARQPKPSIQPPSEPAPPAEKGAVRRWIHGALFDNLGLKALSIVLAITVFLLVNDDKDREITVRVGVLYVLPADKVLVSDRIDEVRVTLRGPWRRLRRFDERELGRISVDLRDATNEVVFTPDMVRAPLGLTVAGISPRSMRVAFDKRAEKIVEVVPATAGRPQHGYVAVEVKASPPTAHVRGGEKLLAMVTTVPTQEVSLEGRTESFTATTRLAPQDGIELVSSDQASVHVQIEEKLVTQPLPHLPIALQGEGTADPTKWTVTPTQVDISLTGALLAVEKAKETIRVSVKVLPSDRGQREAEVVVVGLPPGVGFRKSPERVLLAPVAPQK